MKLVPALATLLFYLPTASRITLGVIGWAGLPDDLRTWQTFMSTVLRGVPMLEVVCFSLGTLCLLLTLFGDPRRWAKSIAATVNKWQDKTPPTAQPIVQVEAIEKDVPKEISQYEAGRKLKVIDDALDLLKEATPLIEMGGTLLNSPWLEFRMDTEKRFPTQVSEYGKALKHYASKVDDLRNSNQEYEDVMGALQQIYYNDAMLSIHDYATACKTISDAAGDGSKGGLVTLLQPTKAAFGVAVSDLVAWQNKARGDLTDLRKVVALV